MVNLPVFIIYFVAILLPQYNFKIDQIGTFYLWHCALLCKLSSW